MVARELGYTLKDFLDHIGEGELDLWWELHTRQPFGSPWHQTGQICATIANANPWGRGRAYRPEEFMPLYRPPQTPEQLHKAFLASMAGLGVKIVDKACSDSHAKPTTPS